MPLLIVWALFIPLGLAVADAGGKKFLQGLPFVFLGLNLVLYVLGLFGLLAVGPALVVVLWAGAVAYLGYRFWHDYKARRLDFSFCAGVALFALSAAVLWWMNRGVRFSVWDEFSHWGRAAKAVYMQNLLPSVAKGEDLFREYPPSLAPLQALVNRLVPGGFREDVVIYTQSLFSVSLLLYPLSRVKTPLGFILTPLLLLAPTTVFWSYYISIMADGILGVAFAFVLLAALLGPDYRLAGLGLAMLPLIKTTGLLWAAVALAVLAVSGLPKKLLARLALCPLGAFVTWKIFLWAHAVPKRWQIQPPAQDAHWQMQTVKNYLSGIFAEANYGWPVALLPFMGFFAVFLALWALLRRDMEPQVRRRFTRSFFALFGAGLVYTVLLLLNYLFLFSPYEAVRLASLSRYLNTYLAGALVFLAGWAVSGVRHGRAQLAALGGGVALWALLSNPPVVLGYLVQAPRQAVQSTANQLPYTQAAQRIREVTAGQELARVYVIAQDDLGITTLRLDYELSPQHLPPHVSSIGPDYLADDLLSQRMNAAQWAQLLEKDYDYVYLFSINDSFVQNFGSLFDGPMGNGQMFRVEKTTSQVRLVPLG